MQRAGTVFLIVTAVVALGLMSGCAGKRPPLTPTTAMNFCMAYSSGSDNDSYSGGSCETPEMKTLCTDMLSVMNKSFASENACKNECDAIKQRLDHSLLGQRCIGAINNTFQLCTRHCNEAY